MTFESPEVTDDHRMQLYQIDSDFEHIQRRLNQFIETLSPEGPRRIERHENATLSVSDKVLEFQGYGQVLRAKPEYIRRDDEWLVSYLFHIITKPLVGDAVLTPVYAIEILSKGTLLIGTEETDMVEGPMDIGYIHSRIKANLLHVVLKWVSK